MRVRPFRSNTDTRRPAPERRPHQALPAREAQAQSPMPAPPVTDEGRARASGGPDDQAAYSCSCGYVFQAQVSTSVACPHCGTSQAW